MGQAMLIGSDTELKLHELRQLGFTVAIHNDYRWHAQPYSFWLLTHAASGRFIKAEGPYDPKFGEALIIDSLLRQAYHLETKLTPCSQSLLFTKLAEIVCVCQAWNKTHGGHWAGAAAMDRILNILELKDTI